MSFPIHQCSFHIIHYINPINPTCESKKNPTRERKNPSTIMSKFTQILCIIFAFVSLFSNAAGSRPHPVLHASAPENQPSCDSFELNMNDCSPYLEKNSIIAEPGTSCCSGVMDVWKVDSKCAGEVLKGIVNLRNMNETRATQFSSTCGTKAKSGWTLAIFVMVAVLSTAALVTVCLRRCSS